MKTYHEALSDFLKGPTAKQGDLAVAIGKSQAAISRYARGERVPDRQTAEAIDAATKGSVPFSTWQADAMRKIGLAPTAPRKRVAPVIVPVAQTEAA